MGDRTCCKSRTCGTSVRALRICRIVTNGAFLPSSLEHGVRLCAQQESAHRVPLPSGTRWLSPTRRRWSRHWRSLRRRTPRPGHFHILTRASSRTCHRTCRRGLDRGEINLALGGVSLFSIVAITIASDTDENSSGQHRSWMPPFKDLAFFF